MKNLIRDMFTGTDNKRWELARIMGAWSIMAYSIAFLYAVGILGHTPEWASLGTGFGAVLLGAGALIGIKDIANPMNRKTGPTTQVDVDHADVDVRTTP